MEREAAVTWTDDRLEELRRLWVEETLSSSEIAERMGISRGTVMGKINRLGLLRHRAPFNLPQSSGAAEQPEAPTAPSTTSFELLENHASSSNRISKYPTIFELRTGQCRFPLGSKSEPAEFFCGQPAVPHKPYCHECCQRAYAPIRLRK